MNEMKEKKTFSQVFVVHGVGQVVDDTTIIRNTNILRDNISALMQKNFPRFHVETGQRVELFPVEWRSALRLDDGMVHHITPQRIMGLRNLLNSSGKIFEIIRLQICLTFARRPINWVLINFLNQRTQQTFTYFQEFEGHSHIYKIQVPSPFHSRYPILFT
jgi:hypothetical protein